MAPVARLPPSTPAAFDEPVKRKKPLSSETDQSVPGDLQDTLAKAIAGCHLWLRRRMQEAPRDR